MKHCLTSTYSKQILECRTEVDTKGYVRNKVASVAVGRCAVTELPLAFAALFAQDAAQVMRCYGSIHAAQAPLPSMPPC